jgi:hypothetical protein
MDLVIFSEDLLNDILKIEIEYESFNIQLTHGI